jgi:hypothetical protein
LAGVCEFSAAMQSARSVRRKSVNVNSGLWRKALSMNQQNERCEAVCRSVAAGQVKFQHDGTGTEVERRPDLRKMEVAKFGQNLGRANKLRL